MQKANGISYFKDIAEAESKESPRLNLGSKILNMIGIQKQNLQINQLKFMRSKFKLEKKFEIKNFYKDHRIMALCTIAALTFRGEWRIHDP